MKEKTVAEEYRRDNILPREVGIEIEMEGKDLCRNPGGNWKATADGSLRGEAIEYVLRQPVIRDNITVALSYLQRKLAQSESLLDPSGRAGVHVHVNCQELTFRQTLNFVCLYLIFEDVLLNYCGKEREGNLFCLRAKDAEFFIAAVISAVEQGSFASMQNDNFRYAALNMSSLAKYGSLEFRAMRSTADFGVIDTWAKILLKIKDASLRFNHPREMVEALSANGHHNFVRQILEGYDEVVGCPDMRERLMEGVRRVQDIAYTYNNTKEDTLPKKKSKEPKINQFIEVIWKNENEFEQPMQEIKKRDRAPRPRPMFILDDIAAQQRQGLEEFNRLVAVRKLEQQGGVDPAMVPGLGWKLPKVLDEDPFLDIDDDEIDDEEDEYEGED